MVDELRNDDVSDVAPEMGLELEVAIRSEEEILGEALPVLAEAVVERVVREGGEPSLDRVEEGVLVASILLVEELVASVAETVGLLHHRASQISNCVEAMKERETYVVELRSENEPRLEKGSPDESIELLEPLPETLIVPGIGSQVVDGVHDRLNALTIGESLEESPELGGSALERWVLSLIASLADVVGGEGLGVIGVGLDGGEEPSESLLVVLVLLALDEDLLETVDVLKEKG